MTWKYKVRRPIVLDSGENPGEYFQSIAEARGQKTDIKIYQELKQDPMAGKVIPCF